METKGPVEILRFSDTLDRRAGERCGRLLSKVATGAHSSVLLDLTATSHVHSSGLAAFMTALRTLAIAGMRATVICPNRALRAILEVCEVRRFARIGEHALAGDDGE